MEHPWDDLLRTHIRTAHSIQIHNVIEPLLSDEQLAEALEEEMLWDLYKQGLAVIRRATALPFSRQFY